MFFVCGIFLAAQDFGILADQSADAGAHGVSLEDPDINYSGSIIPYITFYMGEKSYLLLSAGFTYQVDPFFYVPEILQTELSIGFGPNEIKLGRMQYSDPFGIIANGYFDGGMLAFDVNSASVRIGGWYTGYLFKTRANIAMTDNELLYLGEEVKFNSWENLENTYFAPRRVLSLLGWEKFYLGGALNMKFTALGQFDLTEANLHSQYIIAEMALESKHVVFDLGGCYELIQDSTGLEFQEMKQALAARIGLTFIFPGSRERRFSLRGLFTSGAFENGLFVPFMPLTTVPQGNLLNAKISGLSVLSLNYLARPGNSFSVNWNASYFVRSDLGTYTQYPVIGINSDGYFLGPEFYLMLMWNTQSGFKMNLGGGVFVPALGDAAPNADILWRAEISLVFSLL